MKTKNAYPIVIIQDRYGGAYSKGKWIAIADADDHVDECGASGPWDSSDVPCFTFWTSVREAWESSPQLGLFDWIAVGQTPDEALANLLKKGWKL